MRAIHTVSLLITSTAILLAVMAITVLIAYSITDTGEVGPNAIAQAAEREKQAILSAMTQGQILYFKAEEYKKVDPTIPAHLPWVHPSES